MKEIILNWVTDSANADQKGRNKQDFLLRGKYEKTRLKAVEIKNPTLQKAASTIYKEHKNMPFQEVLQSVDQIMTKSDIYEAQLLAVYLLEKFKKHFDENTFNTIDQWIDDIDYWAISDHLAINLFGHFPLHTKKYQDRLFSWLDSDNYWRRRQALTAYLSVTRNNPVMIEPVIRTIEVLLPETNFYIGRAIQWILRESYRKHPENHTRVYEFVKANISFFSKTNLRDTIRYLDKKQQSELLDLYDASS